MFVKNLLASSLVENIFSFVLFEPYYVVGRGLLDLCFGRACLLRLIRAACAPPPQPHIFVGQSARAELMIPALAMRLIIPSMALIATARPLGVSAFTSARSGSTTLRRLSSRSPARFQHARHPTCTRRCNARPSLAPIDGSSHCFAEANKSNKSRTLANGGTSANREKIVLWRGESEAGYSFQFRHQELSNSIAATFGLSGAPDLNYNGMLKYDGERELSERDGHRFGIHGEWRQQGETRFSW